MFYLKYRPRTISELDNAKIKTELINILTSGHIPHAFLFVGQKGTGKTSTARILAKTVNCLNNKFGGVGDSIEPCNKCANCVSTDNSTSPDVLEIDAASNRGIDEIRSLIKESSFLPMSGRYRVFIIDEAHMITPDAFNALLKTLEEPPISVIFVLATTNLEKVPKTIISRCFFLNFGKARKDDILGMLKRIVKHEKIKIDNTLLSLVSERADHSFRDATKILEELVIHKKDTLEEGKNYLGLKGDNDLLEVISNKDLASSLKWIENYIENNASIKNLIIELLEELHTLLLVKNGITVEKNTALENIINLKLTIKEISLLMKLFTQAYENLKISPLESIPLEVALVEFYNQRNK